ncbi:ABC transporter permease [Staphylococcus arlettae]|uniref:ABC transporter permease n=1 Tax=Staphylococcus arlettae TaxID=29378 RepID=UPI000E69FA0D|nr:ABC transporter permease [Staphylococcus arlettae]RIM82043.1 ABC transporter permease [Staphylococcus arlettae]
MRQYFNKTLHLTLFYFKRNLVTNALWVISIALLTLIIPPAFKAMYPTQRELNTVIPMLDNPAVKTMLGPIKLDDVNIATVFAHEMLLFTAIVVAIMNILFVGQQTRGDEERGRLILLNALPIGKHAQIMSVMLNIIILNLALFIPIGSGLLVMSGDGVSTIGSLLYALNLSAIGVLFGFLTLVVAQLATTVSGTTGITIGILMLSYFIRAIGDGLDNDLSLISPLGWLSRTFPYAENNWWPLVFIMILALICLPSAMILKIKRDINSGYLPEKSGHTHIKRYMKSPLGLQIRLQRTLFISFACGMLLLGLSYGSIFGTLDTFFEDNPLLKQMLVSKGDNYAEQFLPTLMVVMAMVATIPTLISLFKFKKDNHHGYTLMLLANPMTRLTYFGTYIILSIINAFTMIFLASLGLYIGQYFVMDEPLSFISVISSGIIYIPAILAFVALGILILGVSNKLTSIVYAYLAYCFVVVYIGNLLNVREWLKNLTPFHHIPQIPIDDFTVLPLIILIILALCITVFGLLLFQRKDL